MTIVFKFQLMMKTVCQSLPEKWKSFMTNISRISLW